MLRYVYNCVNPKDAKELAYIIDNAEEITREEFEEKVSKEDLEALKKALGYDEYLKMEDDWHVSYWKSEYNYKPIYYFSHSGIEYVFKNIE